MLLLVVILAGCYCTLVSYWYYSWEKNRSKVSKARCQVTRHDQAV